MVSSCWWYHAIRKRPGTTSSSQQIHWSPPSWVMGMERSLGASRAILGAFRVRTPSPLRDDVTVAGSTSCNQNSVLGKALLSHYDRDLLFMPNANDKLSPVGCWAVTLHCCHRNFVCHLGWTSSEEYCELIWSWYKPAASSNFCSLPAPLANAPQADRCNKNYTEWPSSFPTPPLRCLSWVAGRVGWGVLPETEAY